MILITGATGNVGGHLVRELCAAGVPVRALVRSRERADDLRGYDCDIAVGSYEEPDSLGAALAGVDRVFLLSPAGPQMAAQEAAIVRAIGASAPDASVVKLAAAGVDTADSRVRFVRAHQAVLAALGEAGVATTTLAPMSFLQNLLAQAAPVQSEGVLRAAVGDARISLVDARDVAAVAAHVLTSDGHDGATYTVTGPQAVSYGEVAERMAAVLGREVRYEPVEPAQQRAALVGAGLPEWVADGLGELDEAYRGGAGELVTGEVDKAVGRPARSIEDFLSGHLAAFR